MRADVARSPHGAGTANETGGLGAVLWDMDGTLVDSEPAWIAAEYELAGIHGGTWSHELALDLVGNDLITSGRYIRDHMGIDLSPERVVEELLDRVVAAVRRQVPWRPGALELLHAHRAAGIPAALVTMSYRRFATAVAEALPAETFDAVVTGDEVSYGKPHPEPYLRAAELVSVEPRRCLAIEDSDTGATSAESAGCHVLVVPNQVPVPAGERRTHRDSLRGLTVADLAGLVRTAQTPG